LTPTRYTLPVKQIDHTLLTYQPQEDLAWASRVLNIRAFKKFFIMAIQVAYRLITGKKVGYILDAVDASHQPKELKKYLME